MTPRKRLSIVLYQETPGTWIGRGVEHDLSAEGRTIGETIRAILGFVDAHSQFDLRHDRAPLSAFRPAPHAYWEAFDRGTPVPLTQLGTDGLPHWEISVAIVSRRPAQRPSSSNASA